MEKYDYIICGGGASGLLLSNAFIKDEFFNDKKILIIERESKTLNDKTFSFWDNQSNVLDRIVFKSWEKAEFKDSEFSSSFNLSPYEYKMVRSDRFYSYMRKKIDRASNFNYLNATVIDIDKDSNQNNVKTDHGDFLCTVVFSSIYEPKKYDFKKYPLINQHF